MSGATAAYRQTCGYTWLHVDTRGYTWLHAATRVFCHLEDGQGHEAAPRPGEAALEAGAPRPLLAVEEWPADRAVPGARGYTWLHV